MLKADGYATSSTYVNTLVSTVAKYDLRKYDSGEPITKEFYPVLKKGSRGAEVKAWQLLLKENGYPLLIDGVFGNMTMEAVMDWQDKHGHRPDGIIGPKTWATVG